MKIQIQNYWIDPKLKKGKHYPPELINLLFFFENRQLFPSIQNPIIDTHLEAEKDLIEKTFLDFFLRQRNSQVVSDCVKRINKRLENVNPQIEYDNERKKYLLKLPYETAIDSKKYRKYSKQPGLYYLFVWNWLAKVIDGLDPRLVRQCEACKKIFISKQKKKFHSWCRGPYLSKLFSARYVKSGKAAEKQKRYRENLKHRRRK
jgi:hypothetical protein